MGKWIPPTKIVYESWHTKHLESIENDLYNAQDSLRDAWSSLPESDSRVELLHSLRHRARALYHDIEKYMQEHVVRIKTKETP